MVKFLGKKNKTAFFGAALETFNLSFSRYALQILVSLDSPIIARAAAGLAAIAFAAMVFCPKIFMCKNIVPLNANVKSVLRLYKNRLLLAGNRS